MRVNIRDFKGGISGKSNENLSGLSRARNCYNFSFSGGLLKRSASLEPFFGAIAGREAWLDSLFTPEMGFRGGAVFHYKKFDFEKNSYAHKLVIFDSNFKGFYVELGAKAPALMPLNVTFTSTPLAVNYRLNGEDVLIIVSPTDSMVVWDGVSAPEIIADAPKITSMDIHYERLFATTNGDSTELLFSDDLDPTNWSESLEDAGFIQLIDDRGKLIKVLSFNDYLYVFREKGISKVYASTSSQANFYVNHLFVSGGRIFADSIALAGDRVMFLSSDGIYIFDGSSTTRVLDELFPLISPSDKVKASFFDGKYYLATHINFECEDQGTLDNNALIVIDPVRLEYEIIKGYTIESMTPIVSDDDYSLVILSSSDYPIMMISPENSPYKNKLEAVFETGLFDCFNPGESKTIRRVEATAKGEGLTITVFNDRGEKVQCIIQEGRNKIPLLLNGDRFGYLVKLDQGKTSELLDLSLVFAD